MSTPRGQRLLPRISSVDSDVGGPTDTLACRLAQVLPLSLGCLSQVSRAVSKSDVAALLLLLANLSLVALGWRRDKDRSREERTE